MKRFYEKYWSAEEPPPVNDPLTPQRLAGLWDLSSAIPSPRTLLDCGAGEGDLVADASEHGFLAIGMDISEIAVQRASARHPNHRFMCHSLEDLPWPVEDGSCDVVVAFEVIEHLLDPRAFVTGAARALKPGGFLAISTPFHGRIKNLLLAMHGFDRHFDAEGPHIRFFSDRAIDRLLESCGFRTRTVRHIGRFAPIWANTFFWAQK